MENATKALLISGGVLIAIIILTVLVKTYSKIGMFQKQQLSKEEAEQIEEFNKDYTKYAGQYVYGTEVITIINKTVDYNKRTGKNITVNIKFTVDSYELKQRYWKNGKELEEKKLIKRGEELTLKNDDNKYAFIESGENIEQLKNRAFKCESIDISNDGRVSEISLVEISFNPNS